MWIVMGMQLERWTVLHCDKHLVHVRSIFNQKFDDIHCLSRTCSSRSTCLLSMVCVCVCYLLAGLWTDILCKNLRYFCKKLTPGGSDSRLLRGYSGFTDLIKNQSTGGGCSTYTNWLFAGPKSDFWDVKKFNFFFTPPQILEFWAINWRYLRYFWHLLIFRYLFIRYLLICEFTENYFIYLFLSGVWAMAVWVIW